MMETAAAVVVFFAVYVPAISIYVAGGWKEFKAEMAKSFGPMPEPVSI